jgi:hypothetical protein
VPYAQSDEEDPLELGLPLLVLGMGQTPAAVELDAEATVLVTHQPVDKRLLRHRHRHRVHASDAVLHHSCIPAMSLHGEPAKPAPGCPTAHRERDRPALAGSSLRHQLPGHVALLVRRGRTG